MASERYPFKRSKYSSHSQIAKWIQSSQSEDDEFIRLLDIGCSRGELSDLLASPKISYEGIEPFSEDCLIAQKAGLNVRQLTAEEAVFGLNEKFKVVVFGDVLEHLSSPDLVLSETKKILAEGGIVFISVPNVAHFTNRLNLLFGKWNYTERGILDRTHLRFFTTRTIRTLSLEAGFRIAEVRFTPIPIEALTKGRRIPLFKFIDFLNYMLTKSAPKLFAYQTLLKLETLP